ncbi:phage Gp37/Gp68 family protein [Burkholderia metallica]|uniref:phage Gp37/Gp68 family protein n=1 Tax=Burkholderia metallica TaxID=488729 RepID=UPI001CF203E2|nr:phage Gp37/Gp68 family protein [Burkholderia metallica]MCA8017781.1 phage Gp37/Gp68 family protein [Burkholderia metallica]
MSENTKIEWCDHTFNPWEGCQKVGPGCDHCYAEARNARFGGGTAVNWGPGTPRRRTSPANWRKPLQWNKAHAEFFAQHGRRQRVFCSSLADVFDNAVDPTWRRDLFDLIELTPNLNWLLLTKRIGNVFRMVADARSHDWLLGRDNVWLGATIVNQAEADRDIPKLLATPARARFLSMEPLLGPVDLTSVSFTASPGYFGDALQWHHQPHCSRNERYPAVDWVIVGGESGPGARPMHPDWARSLRDQCADAGVPFLFKQHGEWAPGSGDFGAGRFATAAVARDGRVTAGGLHAEDYPRGATGGDGWSMVHRAGKRAAGRLLDGRTHDEFPRNQA